jgi:hypothetical protein
MATRKTHHEPEAATLPAPPSSAPATEPEEKPIKPSAAAAKESDPVSPSPAPAPPAAPPLIAPPTAPVKTRAEARAEKATVGPQTASWRVWAHGTLQYNGTTHEPGAILVLREDVAAAIPCLERVNPG